MDSTVDIDVAIVGAGPVGLTLGILLAQQGQRVTILERWPEPYPLPRAVHFDHEVGRILQSCGIGDDLRNVTQAAEVYEWRNGRGTKLLRFGRIGTAPSGWPESSMFSQPDLERLLEQRAATLSDLTVQRGADVVSLTQHSDFVTLGLADKQEVRASYVVGCDGANSTVRCLLDIEMEDLGFFHDWLIVDIILNEERVFDPINLQVCDPARPTTAVSGGPGRRRWEFMRLPNERPDVLSSEETAWRLLAPWDVTPNNARLERHALYTFGARHAKQWRIDRVLLAGDAAHQMPPFAGQGMCSGIRDAANLFWKLGLVINEEAPSELLDTYAEERLPSARQAIQFSMELGKVICVSDEQEAAARDEAMSAAVTDAINEIPAPPGLESGVVDQSDHAGKLFIQGTVSQKRLDEVTASQNTASQNTASQNTSGDKRPSPPSGPPSLVDDVYGAGWRLITLDEAQVPTQQPGQSQFQADQANQNRPKAPLGNHDPTTWFASIGGIVLHVEDQDERSVRWFAEHNTRWVLQRPDFRIYGTATTEEGASQLVERLRAHLITPNNYESATV